MMKTEWLINIMMLFFLFSLSACGYHLLGKEVNLPGGVSKIYVEPAHNKTMEPGLEQIFTQGLLEFMHADGRVQLAKKENADAILKSDLVELNEIPVAFDRYGRATLLQISLRAHSVLIATRENKKLWDSGSLIEREEYPVGDDFLQNDRLRKEALNQMSQRMSRILVELLTSGF